MGRRKPTRPELAMPKAKRPGFAGRIGALKKAMSEPSERGFIPTPDEMFAVSANVDIPDDEAVIIKTVPLKADGVIIGEAHIHDNGTVAMEYFPDADPAALELVRKTAMSTGFSLEGIPDGTPGQE